MSDGGGSFSLPTLSAIASNGAAFKISTFVNASAVNGANSADAKFSMGRGGTDAPVRGKDGTVLHAPTGHSLC